MSDLLNVNILKNLADSFRGLGDISIGIYDNKGTALVDDDHDFAAEDISACLNLLGEDGVDTICEITSKNIYAVAMRSAQSHLLGIWMVRGGSISGEAFINIIKVIDSIVPVYVKEREEALVSSLYVRNIESSQEDISHDLEQNEVRANILKKLEIEENYRESCQEILGLAGEYLGATEAVLLSLNPAVGEVSVYSYWAGQDAPYRESELFSQSTIGSLPFLDGLSYTVSSDSRMPDDFRAFMEKYNLSAGLFLPIFLDINSQMYLCFTVTGANKRWSLKQSAFLNEVKDVIATIIIKGGQWELSAVTSKVLIDILDTTSCGIFVTDFESEDIFYTNKTFEALFSDESDRERFQRKVENTKDTTTEIPEYYLEGAHKYVKITFEAIPWSDGRFVRLCSVYDVSDHRALMDDIEKNIGKDEVTGVENRQRCIKKLASLSLQPGRGAVILINIEGLSEVNISSGYDAGDNLLGSVAGFLKRFEKEEVILYRMGSDEFAILISDVEATAPSFVTESVIKRFKAPWQLSYRDSFLSVYMGVREFDSGEGDYSGILRSAGIALAIAKDKGIGKAVFYEKGMDDYVREKILKKSFLRDCVDNGCNGMALEKSSCEFLTDDGRTFAGNMATLLWDSGELGVLEERDFLKTAGELEISESIIRFKLLSACKDGRYQNDFGYPANRIGTAITFDDIRSFDVAGMLSECISDSGIDTDMFVLCLSGEFPQGSRTDTALLEKLKDIRGVGVHLASLYPVIPDYLVGVFDVLSVMP